METITNPRQPHLGQTLLNCAVGAVLSCAQLRQSWSRVQRKKNRHNRRRGRGVSILSGRVGRVSIKAITHVPRPRLDPRHKNLHDLHLWVRWERWEASHIHQPRRLRSPAWSIRTVPLRGRTSKDLTWEIIRETYGSLYLYTFSGFFDNFSNSWKPSQSVNFVFFFIVKYTQFFYERTTLKLD